MNPPLNNAKDAVADVKQPKITLTLSHFIADDKFSRQYHVDAKQFACISIMDNGKGIAPGHLAHVFEPFFTTKKDGQGTGLGLSMVYGCMQSHHGTVVVDSKLGRGTTVHCYFPMAKHNLNDIESEPYVDVVKGFGEKILLVDDKMEVQEVGQNILEDLGYKVIVASDGKEAIEVFQSNQGIDLVILDMVMPKMGGLDAAKRMREIDATIKIIFLTGYDASQELNKHDHALEDVLLKPFKVGKLSQIVRQVLSRKKV